MDILRETPMDDPAYPGQLTDPMVEVDECVKVIKVVTARYKLPHLLVVIHSGVGDKWSAQIVGQGHTLNGTERLLTALDNQVRALSNDMFCVGLTPKGAAMQNGGAVE